MAIYQINIDEKNIAGKHFLELMKTLPFISINKNKNKKLGGIEKALEDVKNGRVYTAKNTKDLMMKTIK
jgi:hypothetical protein